MKIAFALIRWIWITLSLLVLLAALFFFDGRPNSDADLLLTYGMLVLSFPISVVAALVYGAVGDLAGFFVTVSYSSIVITWLILFVAGYWQWFVAAPWIWRKLHGAMKRPASRISP
jgi:hypothetical protein